MPESYATVVLANCRWPLTPDGTNPIRSVSPIIIGLAYVVMIRELHVLLANTRDAVVFTVAGDVVDTFVTSPIGAPPAFCATGAYFSFVTLPTES